MTDEVTSSKNDPRSPEQRFNVNVHPLSVGLAPDQIIWRYLDIHAALRTVMFNQLRFTRISRFRDEWESRRGAASRALIEEQDRGMAKFSQMPHRSWPNEHFDNFYRETNFVSSWTQVNPDHMAMWLAYTKSDASIAIGSTVRELSKTSTVDLGFADLGEIKYVDPDTWVHNSRDNRELLFVKRPAFNFEYEVRFAIMPLTAFQGSEQLDDYIELDIEPSAIQRLVANPYMDNSTFQLVIEILKNHNSNLQLEKSTIANKPSY
jgi:hypothetical protein